VRKADNLPSSCADCLKPGSLNLLEPSGLIKACNGIALQCVLEVCLYVQFVHKLYIYV
jgi:hypothetical protein